MTDSAAASVGRSDRHHRVEAASGSASVRGDSRTVAEHDVDRILHSSAFRRLAGVTQVAAAAEGPVFHNRQIHSIKVGYMSRRLAQQLRSGKSGDSIVEFLDSDVCEAAGLAHDLGHPPFGHQAERVLSRLATKEYGIADSFEGNAQSFRIVTALAQHGVAYNGLNLTRATLRAMLKYPWPRDPDHEKASKKWGFCRADMDSFLFAMGGISKAEAASLTPDTSAASLEAQIMDWADDIVYAVHDVEDFYRAGLVPLDRLKISPGERSRVADWMADRFKAPKVTSDEVDTALQGMLRGFFEPETPYAPTKKAREGLRMFSTAMIRTFVAATSITKEAALDRTDEARLWVDVLKELIFYYVIDGHGPSAQQHGQETMIETLFGIFMRAADPSEERFRKNLLPLEAQEAVTGLSLAATESTEGRVRVVCDAICTLSELDVVRLHARLTGMDLGTMTEKPL